MVWFKRLAIALAIVIALIVGGGFLLPSSAHVERSLVINVPVHQVFAMVNGFERFNEWSPWAKLDPATQYEFKGPSQGVGAYMGWTSSEPAVGSGSQEIIESTPPNLVRVRLLFEGQDGAVSFHRLEPMETGTKVTWGFDAEFGNDVIGRWFGYLMFDSMLGADYETGLANLKAVLEREPAAAPGSSPASDPAASAATNTNTEPNTDPTAAPTTAPTSAPTTDSSASGS